MRFFHCKNVIFKRLPDGTHQTGESWHGVCICRLSSAGVTPPGELNQEVNHVYP